MEPGDESSTTVDNSTTANGKGDEDIGTTVPAKESKAASFKMMHKIQEFNERDLASGHKPRQLGITWDNLTVKAPSVGAAVNENILSQFDLPRQLRQWRHKPKMQTILHESHGCVKPGEMLLVLGRPGSGCTTLLKMLANRRAGYPSIDGDISFGNMASDEAKHYRGQIVMNTEDEVFFPTLTVGQTMDFATRLKVPSNLPAGVGSSGDYAAEYKDFLLKSLGISHTEGTKVGNEYVRGVSGGERKRVSIVECMATRASIYCWDNSTRGLDASTALDWTRAIRAMTDVCGLSTVVTLYQASNDIFRLFDKVLVLDHGKQIYYGPMDQAQAFMESLGFVCREGANIADFLTGVTVPTERLVRDEFQVTFPRDADAILAHYAGSSIRERMQGEYVYPTTDVARERTSDFAQSVALERHSSQQQTSVSMYEQVTACVIRQYQVILGDKTTFVMKQGSTLVQALISGSLYYNAPNNSAGLFLKGGLCFWSVLFHTLNAMAEVVDSFTGRPVVLKHKSFSYHHPAVTCVAQIIADLPIVFLQITVWSIVLYWMAGMKATAGAFFTFWIVLFFTTLGSIAMFRAIGACFTTFDGAAKVSGYALSVMAMYAGYQIMVTQMHPWFKWFYYINPIAYGFESLLSNELHDTDIPCVGVNLIPNGNEYTDIAYQSCAGVPGATQGATHLTGDAYLHALSYSHDNVWRNFGIVCAFWVFFVIVNLVATSIWRDSSESGVRALIPREKLHKHGHHKAAMAVDEESQARSEKLRIDDTRANGITTGASSPTTGSSTPVGPKLVRNTSVFTWKNLTYTVQTPSGPRVLLDDVQGWVQPGKLTALMGSSGAGKTTLLDVLALRKTDGDIQGSVLVDGRPLSVSFQRSTGYCEQLDVHEPYATVREALEFSALLRQSREVSRSEKLQYVDTIIDMLELHDIADTLIGKPGSGAGLSIEQRKRVTIGVELVSKPKILIFLDEPTSGLDGQSAYNTVRFLRKLADAGQAVLVTIHQPSAQLFSQFDRLLLLAYGGKTVYFGDIGRNGQVVKDYFGRNGVPCPPQANPADHIIDVVSGRVSDKNWNETWLASPEHSQVERDLEVIVEVAAAKPEPTDDQFEYATPLYHQIRVVLWRMNIALYRNTSYINNKVMLHIGLGLLNGFTYWMIGNSVGDLQLRMFTVWVFLFVAPGVVNQLQPLFIERRDIYDAREKKSRIYSWKAFVSALIISEIPYLCVCGIIYFLTWYYTVGFPDNADQAGAILFLVLTYELLYTGIGQFVAAYAPNAVFASLTNPLLWGVLVSFCGVLVPYEQIVPFWRFWMYYLNPLTYLTSSMLTFTVFDAKVACKDNELALFAPPENSTCGDYLASYLAESGANLVDADAMGQCAVCQYSSGKDYLRTLKIEGYYYGWAGAAIVVLFALSSYGLVYLLMKLRTKSSKKAQS